MPPVPSSCTLTVLFHFWICFLFPGWLLSPCFSRISDPRVAWVCDTYSEQECIDQRKSSILDGHLYPLGPVVFAITLLDTGRKVVDYYMTWRGKIVSTAS